VFIRQIAGNGMWLTFFVIVTIALTDTFGMLIGMTIGRHPLTKISPKKTVEGSVGALVVVTLVGAAAAWVPQLHLQWWQGAALGFATSIVAQVGDLVESAFKRDAGVKDAGDMIQGHGGVLDRFDSYLLGGVGFYATLHLLGILQVQ
jgi:phosphatidate cytidylyltransferase